jgi:hypothetical protein
MEAMSAFSSFTGATTFSREGMPTALPAAGKAVPRERGHTVKTSLLGDG